MDPKKRISWIDQLKGFAILMVVYGHNFPIVEKYIYSFHMPLFFLIAGMFHRNKFNLKIIQKRIHTLLIPYFLWAFILYTFWLFIGRHYGGSSKLTTSTLDNFIGIFLAQGDRAYMDWGIPLWFLPCLFLTFIFFGIIQNISSNRIKWIVLTVTIILGLTKPFFLKMNLPWSIDISFVALSFYTTGYYLKNYIITSSKTKSIWLCLLFGILHLSLLFLNPKIDMYRGIYGNPFLFLTTGITGSLFFTFLFKLIPLVKPLVFWGKNTIVILATHLRAATFIKLILLITLGQIPLLSSESSKLLITLCQLIIITPIILFINTFAPILNGKSKNI